MSERTYHLWKEYPTPPYQRWAADIVQDPTTPDGFRVEHHDPSVADASFFHDLSTHLQQPHLVNRAPLDDDGAIVEVVGHATPGEPGHFGEAIRTVPGATIRPFGRR